MAIEVLQVVQEFSTAGGVETVAWELARAFGCAGVSNRVIARVASDDARRSEVPSKVQCVAPWLARIPTRGPLRYLGRALVVPLFTLFATAALRRHPGTVVVSHGDSLAGDILVVHAVNAASLAEKRRAGSWSWLLNPMHVWVALRDRWMIAGLRYKLFVAVSDRVSSELQHHYRVPENRIRVIPNGIDLDRFRPDPAARLAVRHAFGIPADAKLLLFAGHEFARKGLAHAIGALERLGPDVWLLVVGSDNQAPYRSLADRAAQRLVFAGARADMPALYAAADAFVLPTNYETFSLVCMEALACGVPILATRVGGIEDYLDDGVNGYAITTNAIDIANKVEAIFCNAPRLADMRAAARATAEHFGWTEVAAKYIEMMVGLQAAKAAPRL